MTQGVVKEGGHWYREDGSQLLEVPKANGKGMTKTTLRHARRPDLQLAPGVTTIIRQGAQPQLQLWQQRQAIMSALTLPRMPDEAEDDWLRRVEFDMKQTAAKAAEEGSRIHTAIELSIQGRPYAPAYQPHVLAVHRVLDTLAGRSVMWEAERGVTHPFGYGTRCDLADMHGKWCIDFKGKDGDQQALERLRTYESHWMQLAATRAALSATARNEAVDELTWEKPQRRCAIVYVSRDHPGAAHAVEVNEDQLRQGWAMFVSLLRYWQAKQNYRPSWSR